MPTGSKMTINARNTDHSLNEIKCKSDEVLMRVLVNAGMNIDASCDGECACSTCHVYVHPEWVNALESPNEDEQMMLTYTDNPRDTSRLSCQIKLKPELNGLQVEIVGH